MSGIYYNDNDRKACAWMRELIKAGLISDGQVDDRSILDIKSHEIKEFTQCHFFAGIAGWPHALRLAEWSEDRAIWTGSCPCQPFSAAGKRKGVRDHRDLWPAFRDLIAQCRPATVAGEQVASADGRLWLTRVRTDMEGMGYAVGAADLCAAGLGAPHIRQRIYWVADARHKRERWTAGSCQTKEGGIRSHFRMQPQQPDSRTAGQPDSRTAGQPDSRTAGQPPGLGYPGNPGLARRESEQHDDGTQQPAAERASGEPCGMADHNDERCSQWQKSNSHPQQSQQQSPRRTNALRCGAIHSNWGDATTVHCRDGKTRRFKPGIFPLAHGVPGRVGILRGAGNAIMPPLAAEFIQAFVEATA